MDAASEQREIVTVRPSCKCFFASKARLGFDWLTVCQELTLIE